jgi:hypothetical protein
LVVVVASQKRSPARGLHRSILKSRRWSAGARIRRSRRRSASKTANRRGARWIVRFSRDTTSWIKLCKLRAPASTYQPNLAELVASSVWQLKIGGCIFAGAPNVVILAAAIVRPTNTRRSITQLRAIQLSRASSQGSAGFTITVLGSSLPVRIFPLLIRIRLISPRPDQLDEYLQTGKRCSTDRKPTYSAASTLWISATTAAPSPTAAATRLVDPDLTSPMAKTPVRLVSSRSPGWPAREVEFAPVTTKSLASKAAVRAGAFMDAGARFGESMKEARDTATVSQRRIFSREWGCHTSPKIIP